MNRGRCCGCGFESGRYSKLKIHIVACPQFAEVVQTKPARVRGPAAEYEWWEDGLIEIRKIQADLEMLYFQALSTEGFNS